MTTPSTGSLASRLVQAGLLPPAAPSCVTVLVPPGVSAGGSFLFTHLGFTFRAVVPPSSNSHPSPGSQLLVRLPPEAWATAWSNSALTRGGTHPPKSSKSSKPKPKPLTDDEIVARHLSGLISRVEREHQLEEVQRRRNVRRRAEEEREISGVVNRLVRSLEQQEREQEREQARVRREVHACVQRLIARVERSREPAMFAALAWRDADPEVAGVMRTLVRAVEDACDADARERKIEREVGAVVRRLISRVEHTSTEFEALVGDPDYERQQLQKLDQYLVSLGAASGLVFWPGWTIRLDVRQTGGTAGGKIPPAPLTPKASRPMHAYSASSLALIAVLLWPSPRLHFAATRAQTRTCTFSMRSAKSSALAWRSRATSTSACRIIGGAADSGRRRIRGSPAQAAVAVAAAAAAAAADQLRPLHLR